MFVGKSASGTCGDSLMVSAGQRIFFAERWIGLGTLGTATVALVSVVCRSGLQVVGS